MQGLQLCVNLGKASSSYRSILMHLSYMLSGWNISPSPKLYYTWKIKNEERAQLKAHYQNEIESIKGEIGRLTDLLKQVLSSKNFCTTSYENTINPRPSHISEHGGRLNNWESFSPFRSCLSKSSSDHYESNNEKTFWK